MFFDPKEVQDAKKRIKAKREIRNDRRDGRNKLVAKMEQAQAALDAYDAETMRMLDAVPEIVAHERSRQDAIEEYNSALRDGAPLIQAADPRPGMMGQEAEDAQARIVSAMASLGEFTEFDEYEN